MVIEGGRADVAALLGAYLSSMKGRYEPKSPGFRDSVLTGYRRVCDTIGRRVRATTTSGEQVEGTAVQVGEWGDLIVETQAGPASIGFGEIVHLG